MEFLQRKLILPLLHFYILLTTIQILHENNSAKLYINQASKTCSWTVSSSAENGSLVAYTSESLYAFAAQVCQTLGCGERYELQESIADPNKTCFAGCIYHNNELSNCSQTSGRNCRIISEVACAIPYETLTSKPCIFNLTSPKSKSGVILTEESAHSVSSDICRSQGCGEVYELRNSSAAPNSTCLTNCVYSDLHLSNCSAVVRSDCIVLSQVVCGNHQARLVGASHRCAGRVELWRAGQWGTVCDDKWDEHDADVVCAQLGCGYAVSVTGQGVPYGQGRGPIHLDELNCTGTERNLWECPAVRDDHDCGHKEDAGVVCSEYKAVRLTGGLDRCSGRVEIHRNGSWGTVCDDGWDKQEASMVCAMLGCGSEQRFQDLEKPFNKSNEAHWYYICSGEETLWECMEINAVKISHLCRNLKAAGLICNNSRGLPGPTSPIVTTPASTTGQYISKETRKFWSVEVLVCIALSAALLIAIISNIILCSCVRKRKEIIVKQHYSHLQSSPEAEENAYRESVNLVKVTSNDGQANVQKVPPPLWAQSSVESASYDTDYDPSDSAQDGTFPLSTFRNSMRYSAEGRNPGMKATDLQSVKEEGVHGNIAMQGYQSCTAPNVFQGLPPALSVDSFDTSSTSSGEVYGNTGNGAADPACENYENTEENSAALPSPPSTDNFLNQTTESYQDHSNDFFSNLNPEVSVESNSRAESPIYSPVSMDTPEPYYSESEYDDVGNYLQRHGQ